MIEASQENGYHCASSRITKHAITPKNKKLLLEFNYKL